MKIRTFLLVLTTFFASMGASWAADSNSVPAVQGYDVVSYQEAKRPIRGSGHYTASHQGATYIFANQQNLDTFKADPQRYAPAYGGYCAYGVSVDKKFIGDPEVWRVVDNRLYLNLDANIQDEWFKDVPGRIKTADKKWSQIKNKSAASL